MKVSINNCQKAYALSVIKVRKLLTFLAHSLTGNDEEWSELSLIIMDDIGISGINKTYFKKNRPTDVISLKYPPLPGEDGRSCGEIYVNIQRAVEICSRKNSWTPSRELALYIAHGCDHLSGRDDHTQRSRGSMRRRELLALAKAAAQGLVSSLVPARQRLNR